MLIHPTFRACIQLKSTNVSAPACKLNECVLSLYVTSHQFHADPSSTIKALRREKNRLRTAEARAVATPGETEIRRCQERYRIAEHRDHSKLQRQADEAHAQAESARLQTAQRRAAETTIETAHRLELVATRARLRRSLESTEQTAKRLQAVSRRTAERRTAERCASICEHGRHRSQCTWGQCEAVRRRTAERRASRR